MFCNANIAIIFHISLLMPYQTIPQRSFPVAQDGIPSVFWYTFGNSTDARPKGMARTNSNI